MVEQFEFPDGDPNAKPRKVVTIKPKKATIAKRPKEEAPLSDATCTPKWLADMLPPVDFDPCSNDRSWIRAAWAWSLEKKIDGLKMPWRGLGFVNFPYSLPLPWCVKGLTEMQIGNCTELITLAKLDPSTEWWHVLVDYDPATILRLDTMAGVVFDGAPHPLAQLPDLWTFNDRLEFDEHPDLIEERRQERLAARRKLNIEKGRDPDFKIDKIHGRSSNNFCSAIIHHRPANRPPLNLHSVATRWVRA